MSEETPTNKSPETEKPKGTEYKRGENFIDRYANNVYFQGSLWDLKLIFGSLDQSINPNHVTQHTAISLPWAQVKVLTFILRVHLLAHEARAGRVKLLPGIVPPLPPAPPAGVEPFLTDDAAYMKAKKLYEEFIAENPEVIPREQQGGSKGSSKQ